MKNKLKFIALLFIGIMLTTGFKSETKYFPAPLDETVAAFYLNFAKTGIYKDKEENNKNRLLSDINYVTKVLGQPTSTAENLLNEFFLSGTLKLKEIFAYYSDPMSFSILLTGNFDVDKICEMIGEDKVVKNESNASTLLNVNIPGNQRLLIEIMPNLIIMCPENISGNIFDNLIYERNKVKKQFPEFYYAVSEGTYTALEAKLNEKDTKVVFPDWLAKLKQVNVQIAAKETNMQMFFSTAKEMNKATEKVKKTLSSFEASINENDEQEIFSLNSEDQNLYITANNPNTNLARTILNRTTAFILQFFLQQ